MNLMYYLAKWFSFMIIRKSTQDVLAVFRSLERIQDKLTKRKNHIIFNNFCIDNNVLPIFTNIKLYDDAAKEEEFVHDFRKSLVKRENVKLDKERSVLRKEFGITLLKLMYLCNSKLKIAAFLILLKRINDKNEIIIHNKHVKKLTNLFGAEIFLKNNDGNNVLNLSSIDIENDTLDILNLGMNCHLASKFDNTKEKLEIERLFTQINTHVSSKNVEVNQERLKCELKRYGLQPKRAVDKDLLSKEEYEKLTDLRKNNDIVIRKADKSNTFVILDKDDYNSKIDNILRDDTKFKEISESTIQETKDKLNLIVERINKKNKSKPFRKLIGHYEEGYIYGNPKIHKDKLDPPLRPIISTIGTPMYEISKVLNSIITKYMPNDYSLSSTNEFVSLIKTASPSEIMASLDVESLFTNVPVHDTIDIIINHAYNHPNLEKPKICKKDLKLLLEICTTECPFKTPDGRIFVQTDGISMGCVLGPTFANYYMGNLENKILKNLDIKMYTRYVDDIFISALNLEQIYNLKELFERNSVLKFTVENQKYDNSLSFLDVNICKNRDKFKTKVHIKSTNDGSCLNFNSICPMRYKTGVIKGFLHRAHSISSDWDVFNIEIRRIKQILVNNNFPLSLIDKTIAEFLERKQIPGNISEPKQVINLYFKAQMTQNYSQREDQLQSIIKNNVKSKSDKKLKLMIYYKNRKLKSSLIKNSPKIRVPQLEESHVVYQYNCPNPRCNAGEVYIGYTTNTLSHRLMEHYNNGSIKKHNEIKHRKRPSEEHLRENTKILKRGVDWYELQIMESILIKDKQPSINKQFRNFARYLNIF